MTYNEINTKRKRDNTTSTIAATKAKRKCTQKKKPESKVKTIEANPYQKRLRVFPQCTAAELAELADRRKVLEEAAKANEITQHVIGKRNPDQK